MDFKVVKVTWLDTLIVASWTAFKDIKPLEVISIGWLAHEGDDVVCLIGLIEPNCLDQGNAIQIIPRGCIVKVEEYGTLHKMAKEV